MKYADYKEKIRHGTFDFPIAYYAVDYQHPRYEMMLHWHPEYELIRIRSGTMDMNLDGQRFTAEAGDTVVVTDGVCHSGTPHNCAYECLVFDLRSFVARNRIVSRQVQDILSHQRIICPLVPRDVEELDTLTDTLFTAMQQRQRGYELFVQGCLYQLLGVIVRDQLHTAAGRANLRAAGQQTSLKNAVALIEEQYASHLSLDDLARASGMTKKYFCSFFRSMTQKTPFEYLNFYRVEMAREQLLGNEKTVTEVAYGCGFNDVSYFTKMFRRYTGTTPLNYRKNHTAP